MENLFYMIHIIANGVQSRGWTIIPKKQTSRYHNKIHAFFESIIFSFTYTIDPVSRKDSRFNTEEDRRILAEKEIHQNE